MKIFCSRCGVEQTTDAANCPSCGATIVRPLDSTTVPARNTSAYRWKNMALAAACGLYLVYPSMGMFELIPDFIPLVGSLDEATATAGLLYALSNLGWIPWRRQQ